MTPALGRTPVTRPGAERRREPRFPLEAPAIVHGPGSSVRGRTVDASSIGLLVELEEPLGFLAHQVGVELTLSDGRQVMCEADVVRRALSSEGRLLLALRLAGSPAGRALRRSAAGGGATAPGRPRPSRAKPRAPRAVHLVRQEIRALGTRVLELAIAEPEAPPPQALGDWLARLAAELGLDLPPLPRTNRLMVRAIADLHRRAAGAERY
jgi:hypothetical protein